MASDTVVAIDKSALPDIQNGGDRRGVALFQAGIKDVCIPMTIEQPEGSQNVQAMVSMTVGLASEHKGVNMSRFMVQLAEWSGKKAINVNLRPFLEESQARLESDTAFVEFKFKHFVDKKAPVTGISAPLGHDISLKASLEGTGNTAVFKVSLDMDIVIANCCPCSKAISDYGAHNQRALIKTDVQLDVSQNLDNFSIQTLIAAIEESASCPVFPILKRPDEKWVTERQYDNPKFVEDVARDAVVILRKYKGVSGFKFQVEAIESIHAHNAWAQHMENYV